MSADVHPRIRGHLADPTEPLWVTEGVRKADAAVSVGLTCIALLGVANWRGTNAVGGKTALPFWEDVALNGRRVFVAYDSNVMIKRPVHDQLVRFGAFLAGRGADVRYVYLPAAADGGKVGLDDYLAGGGRVAELVGQARSEPLTPELPTAADSAPRPTVTPVSLMDGIATFAKWLHLEDRDPLLAVAAAVVANLAPGDPVWLLVVSPPSTGKTEILSGLLPLP